MGFLTTIGQWILSFFLNKLWNMIADQVRAWTARRELAKRDEEALKKHEQVINNPAASDAEIGESFEDTLNSR